MASSNNLSSFASRWGTELSKIQDHMRQRRLKKWGFVVYRCTYNDDGAWSRFMEILNERTREAVQADEAWPGYESSNSISNSNNSSSSSSGTPLDSLDWSVRQDRATLDHASVDHVRDRFKAWLVSDEAKAEREAPDDDPEAASGAPQTMQGMAPRYMYCIHVDAEALDSVVRHAPQPPEPDMDGVGYVNLVDAVWPIVEPGPDEEQEEEEEEEEDPDDESHDVGWMRVAVDGLLPALYSLLQSSGAYYTVYRKPPTVVRY